MLITYVKDGPYKRIGGEWIKVEELNVYERRNGEWIVKEKVMNISKKGKDPLLYGDGPGDYR